MPHFIKGCSGNVLLLALCMSVTTAAFAQVNDSRSVSALSGRGENALSGTNYIKRNNQLSGNQNIGNNQITRQNQLSGNTNIGKDGLNAQNHIGERRNELGADNQIGERRNELGADNQIGERRNELGADSALSAENHLDAQNRLTGDDYLVEQNLKGKGIVRSDASAFNVASGNRYGLEGGQAR